MAPGDPLDDAIDAVVRAIDRIERASRGPLVAASGAAPLAEPEPADRPDASEAAEPLPPHAALGESLLAHGWTPPPAGSQLTAPPGWLPPTAALPTGDAGAPKKGKKHKKLKADEPAGEASIAALALQAAIARREGPAELHELVGRVVARSQQLDDHLVAAQQLRAEISELVTRLAITASLR